VTGCTGMQTPVLDLPYLFYCALSARETSGLLFSRKQANNLACGWRHNPWKLMAILLVI